MDSVFQLHLKEVFCALCAALLLLFTVTSAEEGAHVKNSQCHNYAGGHVYPGEAFRVPVSDHSLHLSKAKISKPAPQWEGTAVINGEFKELKLSDYRGKYLVFFFYPLDLGLFIIDEKGVLRQITMNDLPVGRSVDETLRLVQAFQYTDKHGEVCPAGWKPGSDTVSITSDLDHHWYQLV
ncbi:Peroxiredoxin-4 [Nibea albiflora]|uniref:Peroxiredoxin-4 n=1 Tax=Nibea albiflora TaxID=240163 RepID=A0ACB7F1W3_NIBAL|nr:Peroxiredoxin-4 [Nibea albiflora]